MAIRRLPWGRRDLLATFGLCALCLLFFWPLITPDPSQRQYIAAGDFTNQFYPYHFFAAAEWWSRRIPLWNPYMFGGHPFQADIQTAVFYPLSLLVNLVAGRDGLPFWALESQGIADYLLAALFSYLFLRLVVGDRLAAFLGAICYALGGFLSSYPFQQLAILETAAWLPLVLFFIERGVRAHHHLVSFSAAGLAMAVAILGGHPQSAMFMGYASLAFLLFRCVSARLSWQDTLKAAAVFLFVAVGAAAVQLLPTYEFAGLSSRDAISYNVAATGYDYKALPGLLLPAWRNEQALYLGAVPLLLAIFAAIRLRRGPVLFWSALAGLALVLSLGDRGFLFRLFHAIVPGFATFQGQERIALLFSFAGAVLAAYGLAAVRAGNDVGRRQAAVIALVLAGMAAAGIWLFWSLNDVVGGAVDVQRVGFPRLLLLLAVCAGIFWFIDAIRGGSERRSAYLRNAALVALVGLAVIDVLGTNWRNNMSPVAPNVGGPQLSAIAYLSQQQQRADEPLRIRPQNAEALPANYGAIVNLSFASGDSPIVIRRTNELFNSNEEWRLWQLLNVKYVVSFGQPSEALETALEAPPLKVYRNRFSLPRAWVVEDVRRAESAAEAKAMTLDAEMHPGKTAVVEGSSFPMPDEQRADNRPLEQRITFAYYSPRRLFLRTETSRDGLLVLSEAYYPWWRAKLDGISVPVHRVNYILRGIALPAGKHELEMVFDPPPFWLGLGISASTVFGVGILGLALLWKLRRQRYLRQ